MKEILKKHGFYCMEESTQTYSHKTLRPTLSICKIDDKSKKSRFKVNTDKEWDKSEEVIVPFQNIPENDRLVIRNENELIQFYYNV